MSDDSMRAKARATFGKEFMAAAAPQGYAKNAAVALQQRANARPIPTYKIGGVVKKDPYGGDRTPGTKIPAPRPSVEGPDIRAGKMKPRVAPGADKKLKAAQDRASALGLKDGGKASKKPGLAIVIAVGKTKPVKKAEGGLLEALGVTKKKRDNMDALKESLKSSGESGMKGIREDMASAARESIGTQTAARAQPEIPTGGKQTFGQAFKAARANKEKQFSWNGKDYTTDVAGDKKSAPRLPDRKAVKTAAPARKTAEKPLPTALGPDIVVIGRRPAAAKVATKASPAPAAKRESGWDRLVSRNVESKKKFDEASKSGATERARRKAEAEMAENKRAGREAKRIGAGSYKPAGRFVVAPIKRAEGGKVMPERILARAQSGMKCGGKVKTSSDTARKLATEMGGMAAGGAGKVRKGQAPIKKAQGGAAKVRKGMMSQSGDITSAVKPKKGIGGIM